jgi:hypothetical protein
LFLSFQALLQAHDVVAQEVYGEEPIRVTPPPPSSVMGGGVGSYVNGGVPGLGQHHLSAGYGAHQQHQQNVLGAATGSTMHLGVEVEGLTSAPGPPSYGVGGMVAGTGQQSFVNQQQQLMHGGAGTSCGIYSAASEAGSSTGAVDGATSGDEDGHVTRVRLVQFQKNTDEPMVSEQKYLHLFLSVRL